MFVLQGGRMENQPVDVAKAQTDAQVNQLCHVVGICLFVLVGRLRHLL